MRRKWTVEADDREEVERAFLFAAEALHFLGGALAVVAHRVQLSETEFVGEEIVFNYESYAPAERREAEVEPESEEHADELDREPAEVA